MKILVLQLARFGDILQSWPTLQALRRTHPSAEIHVLVRGKFRDALHGLEGLHVHIWPTAELLCEDTDQALLHLENFLQPLRDIGFDRVVNLSFSPLSSYLTQDLAGEGAQVQGYTRHSDGYLQIPDDSSAYFYAQVGIEKFNRYHLVEIFASVCGIDLAPSDYCAPGFPLVDRVARVVVHMGASQREKSYPPELWRDVIHALLNKFAGTICLIGSQEERAVADTICSQIAENHSADRIENRIENRVGRTSFPELFGLIGGSCLVIGADSSPMHVASLTKTPALNLSSRTVKFWETGPISPGSRILFADELQNLSADRVAAEALAMLDGKPPITPCYTRVDWQTPYVAPHAESSFAWQLIQAMYTGTDYPPVESETTAIAFRRLTELAELALQQIQNIQNPTAAQILQTIDQALTEVARICADVGPVVNWFNTQRLRLGPAPLEQTLADTKRLFEELAWVCAVYAPQDWELDLNGALNSCKDLPPLLREGQLREDLFLNLVTHLQGLARHSTKVGDPNWSYVVKNLEQALVAGDYIELADQLQYELEPQLLQLKR